MQTKRVHSNDNDLWDRLTIFMDVFTCFKRLFKNN